MQRALLIMGPTASGKSALALDLARALGGEIINADSMQVYADLRILTARPSPDEEARAPHHLYGAIDGAERYSVGRWLRAALGLIGAIAARGGVPIVVGGTGLYFKALTQGLADIPTPAPEIHSRWRAVLDADGPEALHRALNMRDPEGAAALSPMDGARLLRALCVLEETGAPIRHFQARTAPALPPEAWRGVALAPPRAALYAAIDQRFEAMVKAGALAEAAALRDRQLDPTLPIMKAHGAPALMAHLAGGLSLQEAIVLGQRDTRHYAKRQFTWMAHQAPDWRRLEETDPAARARAVASFFSTEG